MKYMYIELIRSFAAALSLLLLNARHPYNSNIKFIIQLTITITLKNVAKIKCSIVILIFIFERRARRNNNKYCVLTDN